MTKQEVRLASWLQNKTINLAAAKVFLEFTLWILGALGSLKCNLPSIYKQVLRVPHANTGKNDWTCLHIDVFAQRVEVSAALCV